MLDYAASRSVFIPNHVCGDQTGMISCERACGGPGANESWPIYLPKSQRSPIPSNAEKRQDQTSPTHTQTYLGKWNKSPSRCRTPSYPSPHPRYRYLLVFGRRRRARNLASSALLAYLPSDPPLRAGDALPAGDRREVDLVHRVGAVGAALAGGWRRRTAVVAGARRRVAVVPAHLCSFVRETPACQRENGKRPEQPNKRIKGIWKLIGGRPPGRMFFNMHAPSLLSAQHETEATAIVVV